MSFPLVIAAFGTIDYAILFVYIIGITLFGSWFMRNQSDAKDFFLAGRRMGWFPVGLSVMATNFSAISFLGMPGYIVGNDMVMAIAIISLVWVLPLTVYLFLNFFYRLQLYTAYEYIEKRFNPELRALSSGLFLFLRLGWLATALYATSLALSTITGLGLVPCVLIIGLLATIYAALGGMEAVIWTDVVQVFILVAAMVLVLWICLTEIPGGLGEIWSVSRGEGRTRIFSFHTDITRLSTWSVLIGASFINLATYGVDQVIVQRCFATRDFKTMKQSVWIHGLIVIPLIAALALIGLCIFAYYTIFPERLAEGLNSDQWFSHFIVHQLPIGISGLVVAGLFAATMSSVDSGINSLTAATMIDFYRRFWRKEQYAASREAVNLSNAVSLATTRWELMLSRVLTLFWGGVATLIAIFVNRLGTIMEIIQILNGLTAGVLLGVFLLGVLTHRANGWGALISVFLGLGTVAYVAFGGKVHFFWYSPIGCLVTFVTGYLLSLFFAPPGANQLRGLTRWAEEPPAR
jgi:solute:Na+ symporter, SSS family